MNQPIPKRRSSIWIETFRIFERTALVFALMYLPLHGSEPPDLSQLTTEQKNQGFGQFQKPDPPASPSKPNDSEQEREKEERKREAERLRQQQRQQQQRQQAAIGLGTTATATGMVLGSRAQSQKLTKPNYDPIVDPNIPLVEEPLNTSDADWDNSSPPTTLGLTTKQTQGVWTVFVHSLFLRDLARTDAQIVDGINANQLGWAGAPGIEGGITYLGKTNDYGGNFGFALAEGEDELRSSSVNLLYTQPHIGFVASPFLSHRRTSLATAEANLVLQSNENLSSRLGIRWLHLDDTLQNQVMPNGLSDRIKTNSDSFVLQYALEPTLQFQWMRVESQFQVGVGPMFGKSNTQLRNFVGGPPGLPDEIVVDRVNATGFFKGQLGLAIPVRSWISVRTGVQLLAQSSMAPAAAQMSQIDFGQQRYHLRTETMMLGALYAGMELRR